MSEPMYAYDCSNDHHGRECTRIPCDCTCHTEEEQAAKARIAAQIAEDSR